MVDRAFADWDESDADTDASASAVSSSSFARRHHVSLSHSADERATPLATFAAANTRDGNARAQAPAHAADWSDAAGTTSRPLSAPIHSKTRSTEVYGFVLWITTFVIYVIFLLWAFLPEETLIGFGITYYPAKWWAIALPSYVLVSGVFVLVAYVSYNLMHTNPLQSFGTFTDCYSRYLDKAERERAALGSSDYSIPEVSDLPIATVNRLLYQFHPNLHGSDTTTGEASRAVTFSAYLPSQPPFR